MDVTELNQLIQSNIASTGNPFVIVNKIISESFIVAERAHERIYVLPGKHIEFKNCTFNGVIAFTLDTKSDVRFTNNSFRTTQVQFLECKSSSINFFGDHTFAGPIELNKCSNFAFYIGEMASIKMIPVTYPGTEKARLHTKSILVHDSQEITVSINGDTFELIQSWGTTFKSFFISNRKLRLLQFNNCKIDWLRLVANKIIQLDFYDTEFNKTNLSWSDIKEITIPKQHIKKGISATSLFCLARQYKKNGDVSTFVKLYRRAFRAQYLEILALHNKSILDIILPYTLKEGERIRQFNLKSTMVKFPHLLSFVCKAFSSCLKDKIFNLCLGRFYSPMRMILFGFATIFIFSMAYKAAPDGLLYQKKTAMYLEGGDIVTTFVQLPPLKYMEQIEINDLFLAANHLTIHEPKKRIRSSEEVIAISFSDALYFSFITFCTVGYGDITPIGFIRFVAAIQGLMGIVFAASLSVVIARRYA